MKLLLVNVRVKEQSGDDFFDTGCEYLFCRLRVNRNHILQQHVKQSITKKWWTEFKFKIVLRDYSLYTVLSILLLLPLMRLLLLSVSHLLVAVLSLLLRHSPFSANTADVQVYESIKCPYVTTEVFFFLLSGLVDLATAESRKKLIDSHEQFLRMSIFTELEIVAKPCSSVITYPKVIFTVLMVSLRMFTLRM